jgi:hypothetical protein
MPERDPIDVANLDRYGSDALPWSRAREPLAAHSDPENPGGDHSTFLSTTRPNGAPHTAPVGAIWHDGDLYFTSGSGTRKSRNLAANPRATIAVRFEGIDLVLEGEATRVTDPETLATLAAMYRAGGWPAEVDGESLTAPYSAPSAGPAPWDLYRFRFDAVFGVATREPWGATRWRFAP